MQWRFPSGAVLQFGYCDNPSDLARYQSAEFSRIYIDELTEWPKEQYEFLFSRMRAPRGVQVPLAMRGATNPGGIGGEWVRQKFGIPEDTIVADCITTSETTFLPARVEDNPSIDLDAYEKSLSKLGPHKFAQLRWGRWVRDGEGLVYYALGSSNIIGALPVCGVARSWKYALGLDFGFTDSTAFVVVAWREEDTCVYVVRSFKHAGLTPSEVGAKVSELEAVYKFSRIVGDIGGLGKGYVEEMRRRFSLPIEPAEKNNKRGYIDLFNGDMASKNIQIVESSNTQYLQELRSLIWNDDRSKERASCENHICDAGLYIWRDCTNYLSRAPAVAEVLSASQRHTREVQAFWERDETQRKQAADSRLDAWWET